jgi:hypothetical protein
VEEDPVRQAEEGVVQAASGVGAVASVALLVEEEVVQAASGVGAVASIALLLLSRRCRRQRRR